MTKTDLLFVWLAVILILPIILLMIGAYCSGFSRELRYLNTEIARTEGAERRFWLHRRRRLWLSLIPFVKY